MSNRPAASPPRRIGFSSGTRKRVPRILIIDDERDFAVVVQQALMGEYEVVVMDDAETALRSLTGGARYDLVLCDVMMPLMDGIELHRRLTSVLPEQAERIVFMSGGAFIVRVEAFFNRVSNLLLEKPFDVDALRALLQRRLGGDHASAQAGTR